LATNEPDKIEKQIEKAGLPTGGEEPFQPKIEGGERGRKIKKKKVAKGPKKGDYGWVDTKGRIWIRCRAHGGYPDHWDVQIDDGEDYIRVDNDGHVLHRPPETEESEP
jgi:hypothetical protein